MSGEGPFVLVRAREWTWMGCWRCHCWVDALVPTRREGGVWAES